MAEQTVANPSAGWEMIMANLDLIHDLMGGTAQMRRAGLKWLPREQAESWEAWRLRLNRSILFNGLARTVQAMAGHALNGEIIVEGADPKLRECCQNLDGHGMSINQLAMRLIQLILRDGIAYLLVDKRPESAMPYVVVIEAAQVIGCRTDGDSGALAQVRIREAVEVPSGRFGSEIKDRIRVYEPGKFELWQKMQSDKEWQHEKSGKMSLDAIPVVTAQIGTPVYGQVRPPLMDLAWLNLAHWQSASDQRHILHIARVPILFARGMSQHDGPIDIGPNRLIMADDASADIKFVEHSGAAIEAGRQDLVDLEDKMAVMGLELLTSRPGNPTATGRAIDQAHDKAMLNDAVTATADSLKGVLKLMAEWLDLPPSAAGTIKMPEPPNAFQNKTDEAELLLKARQSGDLSHEKFIQEIERRGFLTPA